MSHNSLVVLGPTASGKTRLACHLAYHLGGEIISADSRQVYKDLNIGTGKDLHEYRVNNQNIAVHLLNLCEPAQQFYLHQFIEHLHQTIEQLHTHHKLPIICGGSGLYLDALRKDFSYTQIPEDLLLREKLQTNSTEQLLQILNAYPASTTDHVDRHSRKRLIRGIEIAEFFKQGNQLQVAPQLKLKPLYIGLNPEVELRQQRIAARLAQRLNEGLVQEVEGLLAKGLSHQRLQTLGLEYKFLSRYLLKELSFDQMHEQLRTAIFQFAKRQMTWFRKMEKEGVKIHWVPQNVSTEEVRAFLPIHEIRMGS